MIRDSIVLSVSLGLVLVAGATGLLTSTEPDEPVRRALANHTSWAGRIVGSPSPPSPYRTTRAFPKLKFSSPVYIAQEPGTDRIVVAELSGKIYAFPKGKAEPEARVLFLDVGRELYSFSFHPKYEDNGQLFVFSPKDPKDKADKKMSRVSRFVAKGSPRIGDSKSETVIIEWLSGGHNGGEAIIGPDGYLYVCTGDQTSTSDGNNTGQGVDDLLAVMMRLDVDNPPPGKPYGIPKDNPFVKFPGARPEVWAFGFRNPWRMSFDWPTGQLWVGDVGQDVWEMIRLVERGGNYGWSVQEGSHPFLPNRKIGPGPILPPIVEHHHSECRSITGGYVYRGKKFPELAGVYLYGDYEYGKLWGLRYDPKPTDGTKSATPSSKGTLIHNSNVGWHKELCDTALRITSFGVSRDGEVYIVDHPSGEIHKLERAPKVVPQSRFPRTLTETGLFASVKDHELARGVIPYEVRVPQWLDGAIAERFLALPKGVKIKRPKSDLGAWTPDDGAVTLQTLYLDMEAGNPRSRRRIETRLMVKQENHWLGYSYLWNDAQTEAELVEPLGREVVLQIDDDSAPGGRRRHTWHVPSRNECMYCHSRAAGFVLGLRTHQLNAEHDFDGIRENQLTALATAGVLPKLDKKPSEMAALASLDDPKATVTERARSYLQVHCSICHVDSGGGNARFTIRHDTDLAKTKLLGEKPLHGTFGLPEGKLIAPGDPYSSVLFYRVSKLGTGRMPHVGSRVVHERALDVLHDWILTTKPTGVAEAKTQSAYDSIVDQLRRATHATSGQRRQAINDVIRTSREALMATRTLRTEPSFVELRDDIVDAGIHHPDPNVRDLFERFLPEERRVKRLGDHIRPEEILSLEGNAERGRKYFYLDSGSQCRSCHRIGDEGGNLGPALDDIGKKYKRAELLESLLQPSKKIETKFRAQVVLTQKGTILTGILLERSEKALALSLLEDGKSKLVRIPADEVEQVLPQSTSLMPEGLLKNLTAQQAADLLEFLTTLKSPVRESP